jgi:TolB-like protein
VSDVFISYARSTAKPAIAAAKALRGLGYSVWIDEELPAHRNFSHVIEEQLNQAKAVLVLWSAEATKSDWVMDEAERGREQRKLVQVSLDNTRLPMPFGQIQCADLTGWSGDLQELGWHKVIASIGDLVGGTGVAPPPVVDSSVAHAPLPLPDKPSIAVLPFADMAAAKEPDFFADGMVEEIVTALSRFPSLFVIGAGSGLSYRDADGSRKQIAQELGVRYLLEGSVRRSGDKVRISVSLTDAVEGLPIWTERFDGTLEDVFELQDTVANAVAGQIEPSIVGAETRRANARPTQDLGAYELYLRALHLLRMFERSTINEGLNLLDEALRRDPDYALARALLAYTHACLLLYGWSDNPAQTRTLIRDQVRRALRVADDNADVLRYAADATSYCAETIEERAPAEAMIDRALALNPGASMSWVFSSHIRAAMGRVELALEHAKTGLRLDPRCPERPFVLAVIGICMVLLGRIEEAIPVLQEAVQLRAGNPGPLAFLTVAYAHLGRLAEARAALKALEAMSPSNVFVSEAFGGPAGVEIIRSGLALAGADV